MWACGSSWTGTRAPSTWSVSSPQHQAQARRAGRETDQVLGARVPVWASVWDSVVPVLAVDAVSELVLHHGTEVIYDLWEVYF